MLVTALGRLVARPKPVSNLDLLFSNAASLLAGRQAAPGTIPSQTRYITTFETMSKRYQPTPEQMALAEERKAAKRAKICTYAAPNEAKGSIIPRKWIQLPTVEDQDARRVKVMTWNVRPFCSFIQRILVTLVNFSYLLNVSFVSNSVLRNSD